MPSRPSGQMTGLSCVTSHCSSRRRSPPSPSQALRERRFDGWPRSHQCQNRTGDEAMTVVNKCNLPDDLYYVVGKHVWARREEDLVTVGMTDVAQNMAKTIVAVTPKAVGKSVEKGRNIATVESGKWVGPVSAPISGEIVAVNDALVASPGLVNSDPYGAGWVARVRPFDWEGDAVDLVTGPEGIELYRQFLDAEGITCG